MTASGSNDIGIVGHALHVDRLAGGEMRVSRVKWPLDDIARFNGPSQIAEGTGVSSRSDGKQRNFSVVVIPCQNG